MYLLRLSSATFDYFSVANDVKAARAFRTVTLLFHITRFSNIGSIGEVCSNCILLFAFCLILCPQRFAVPHFGFEVGTLVLTAHFFGHCLHAPITVLRETNQ